MIPKTGNRHKHSFLHFIQIVSPVEMALNLGCDISDPTVPQAKSFAVYGKIIYTDEISINIYAVFLHSSPQGFMPHPVKGILKSISTW